MIFETLTFELRDLDDGIYTLPVWVTKLIEEAKSENEYFDFTKDLEIYCDFKALPVQCRSWRINSRSMTEDDGILFPVNEILVLMFAWDSEEQKIAFMFKYY